MSDIAYPYQLAASGTTARTDPADHIRQMLEQLLFTRPGERVNHPDFGCGLLDSVFGPSSPEAAAAIQLTVAAAIQKWLGDVVSGVTVTVDSQMSTLQVNITYTAAVTGTSATATWSVAEPS